MNSLCTITSCLAISCHIQENLTHAHWHPPHARRQNHKSSTINHRTHESLFLPSTWSQGVATRVAMVTATTTTPFCFVWPFSPWKTLQQSFRPVAKFVSQSIVLSIWESPSRAWLGRWCDVLHLEELAHKVDLDGGGEHNDGTLCQGPVLDVTVVAVHNVPVLGHVSPVLVLILEHLSYLAIHLL